MTVELFRRGVHVGTYADETEAQAARVAIEASERTERRKLPRQAWDWQIHPGGTKAVPK